jgi:hypothetical protein
LTRQDSIAAACPLIINFPGINTYPAGFALPRVAVVRNNDASDESGIQYRIADAGAYAFAINNQLTFG